MKITIEFDNGPALVIAPGQLSLQQSTPDKLTLAVPCGTYAIPVAEFAGSLATAEEVAERTAVAAPVVNTPTKLPKHVENEDGLCGYDMDFCICSLAARHQGNHKAYMNHDTEADNLIKELPQ